MNKLIQTVALLIVVSTILLTIGCVTQQPLPPKNEVPITDIKNLEGKWGGLLRFEPRQRRDDYVNLIIKEKGAYKFASYRTIGIFTGTGVLQLVEGKATTTTEKGGTITFTLYDRAGESILSAIGVSHTGQGANAELTRTD